MANSVSTTAFFLSKLKRLLKKFPSLHNELKDLEYELLLNPKSGISLGGNFYKIKLKIRSKGKGKSGGFRIITYLVKETEVGVEVFLVTIYDKSEEENITRRDLLLLIQKIFG